MHRKKNSSHVFVPMPDWQNYEEARRLFLKGAERAREEELGMFSFGVARYIKDTARERDRAHKQFLELLGGLDSQARTDLERELARWGAEEAFEIGLLLGVACGATLEEYFSKAVRAGGGYLTHVSKRRKRAVKAHQVGSKFPDHVRSLIVDLCRKNRTKIASAFALTSMVEGGKVKGLKVEQDWSRPFLTWVFTLEDKSDIHVWTITDKSLDKYIRYAWPKEWQEEEANGGS